MFYIHSPGFGVGFQKVAKQKGVECHIAWKNHPAKDFQGDIVDFNIQHLILNQKIAPARPEHEETVVKTFTPTPKPKAIGP